METSTKQKLLSIYIALIPTLSLLISGFVFAIHHGENWVMSLFFLVLGLMGLRLSHHVTASINQN